MYDDSPRVRTQFTVEDLPNSGMIMPSVGIVKWYFWTYGRLLSNPSPRRDLTPRRLKHRSQRLDREYVFESTHRHSIEPTDDLRHGRTVHAARF